MYLLKYGTNAGYTSNNTNIKNEDPKFLNYFASKLNLRVKPDSPAKAKGGNITDFLIDIAGQTRPSSSPTIGAYQLLP